MIFSLSQTDETRKGHKWRKVRVFFYVDDREIQTIKMNYFYEFMDGVMDGMLPCLFSS